MMTSEKNKVLNAKIIPKNEYNDTTTTNMPNFMSTDKLSNMMPFDEFFKFNIKLNIVAYSNTSNFSNKHLTNMVQSKIS